MAAPVRPAARAALLEPGIVDVLRAGQENNQMRMTNRPARKPGARHFLAIAVLAAGLAAGPGAADTLENRIEAAVPNGFSGQVVVATPTQVLYSGSFGFADRERGEAVAPGTLFDMGSITKTFTATLVLQLAADGRLRLEQPLADFFDGLPPETAAIRIEQLLTHTSGLPQYSGPDEEARSAASFDAWLAGTRLEFEPGDHYAYSNPGYSVLARVVEKLSGQSYEAQLQERLVDPLGLGTIGYRDLPAAARQAVAYDGERALGRPQEMNWLPDGPGWNLRANGGLLASADALARWMQAVAQGRTLPREWLDRQLHRQVSKSEHSWYGYGWAIDQREYGEVVGHTGGNGYFFAAVYWFRDHDLLLAVTNNAFDQDQAGQLLGGLREALGIRDPGTQ